MDVNNEDLSLSLYSYLCKVVGSEDVVRTRRRIYNVIDNVSSRYNSTYISSGSKAEGLDLAGSDFDLIIALNLPPVYENIEDLSNNKQHRYLSFIMDTNDTKPGYTRLKVYSEVENIDVGFFEEFCYNIGYYTFLSSLDFREKYEDITVDTLVTHGPCKSDVEGRFDGVYSLRCQKWISQADKWIHRARLSWPHDRLIERIVQYGVLFVPIGCKNSPHIDFEFRISFNYAEKILVHSFSHVQLLCYALMKIVLKHFIKPKYGDLLCSYFLKTIMFWVSEESLESTWEPHNLLRCFDRCFKRLVYCVTYSTCLHYFIPELNFFEDRFTKSEHDSLTVTLKSLYKSGWRCVLETDLFLSFNSPPRTWPSVSALRSVGITNVFVRCFINNASLMRLIRSVFGSFRLPGKQMYAIVLSQEIQLAAQSIPLNENVHVANKQRYRNYRNCLNHLLQGIHHDAVSGWLLLASFLYTCKQYEQCLNVLNYCLQKCTPDKILLTPIIDTKLHNEFDLEMKQHVKNGLLRTCKSRVVDCVEFEKHSFILPEELSVLAMDKRMVFPPVVFTHFLRCICLHRLNRDRDRMIAYRALKTTVREMYFIPNIDRQKKISNKCISVARQLLAN